jgi:hypothetical protein
LILRIAPAAMAASLLAPPLPVFAGPQGPTEGSGARPTSALNPAISFNALVRASWRRADTTEGGEPAEPLAGPGTGVSLEEAEVVFTAGVDPYLKADAIVAVEDASDEGEEGFEVDLEEVYVTGLFLPRGFGLRAGKMFLPFGRHNLLHRHQFPFIDAALVNERAFGREGLNEPAVELSYLLPVGWFSQLVGAVGDGRNGELFAGGRRQDLAFLGHFKNLWDLSAAATLELGASALYGRRGEDASSAVYGLNATYKYRPVRRAIYRAFELQAEWLLRDRDPLSGEGDGEDGEEGIAGDLAGAYVHARWQVARRLWLQGRYDRVEHDGPREDRWSFLVAFVPSDFSALRLEYASLDPLRGDRDHQLLAQLNFTIGSHPAHAY